MNGGRNSVLQGVRFDVYNYVDMNPGCTRKEVAKGTGLTMSSCTARIKELIDEGYLYEPIGEKKLSSSGINVRTLIVTDRSQADKADERPLRVSVTVSLTRDANGVLGAVAELADPQRQTGKATIISSKKISVVAPPSTPRSAYKQRVKVTEVRKIDLQHDSSLIIEGDYTTIDK
jgi:DNA-binding MarR family transcriptional regulator